MTIADNKNQWQDISNKSIKIVFKCKYWLIYPNKVKAKVIINGEFIKKVEFFVYNLK